MPSATPVALKVRGEPESPVAVAVSVLLPEVVPKVQVGEVAIPLALVVTGADEPSKPPPDATAKMTLTPLTGLPLLSLTITEGAVLTADPAVAL